MKNIFVILALVAIAGCSGMRQGSSSGGMGSESGSGSSMTGSYVYPQGPASEVTPNNSLP